MKHIDQARFVNAALEYWLGIREGSSRRANAKHRIMEKIVANWVEPGIAVEALSPYLSI